MTSCCRANPAAEMFRPGTARKDLRRYRRKGLDDVERTIVGWAEQHGIEGARVLEIGGGIGMIQSELLKAGASRGEIAELVDSYEPYALELARETGQEDRVSYRVVDLLASPDAVDPADVVVLNRVVCCSPDGLQLAATGARLTRGTLLLSFPRDAAWTRAAVRLLNAWFWLLRRSFRTFVHPPAALLASAEAEGLRCVEQGREGFWELAALQRV